MIESIKLKLPQRTIFISTLVFYAAAIMAPHKIVLFFFCFAYFLVLWRLFRNFTRALTALYLTLLPFIVGKLIQVDLISERELNIPGRTFGISADAIFTISDLIVVCMGIVLAAHAIRRTLMYQRNRLLEFLLFLYPVTSVISTCMGSVRPEISIIHSLYTIRPLILYYFFASFDVLPLQYVFTIISGGMLLELCMVVAQMLHSGSLGLVIEPIANFVAIDLSRDAAGGLLRYGGTYMHANALANAILIPLFVLAPAIFFRFEKDTKILVAGFFAGLLTLVFTMSRSAWLGAGLSGGILFYFAMRKWGRHIGILEHITSLQRGIIITVLAAIIIMMAPRLISTSASGGQYGSLETRILLLREYSQTIRTAPYFGVGLEMDVYVQYLRSMFHGDWDINAPNRMVILYFPEPVHSGILRLLVEVGLVGTVPFIGICMTLFYLSWKRFSRARGLSDRLVFLSLLMMYIAVFINSLMQPILLDLPLLVSLTMLYLRNIL